MVRVVRNVVRFSIRDYGSQELILRVVDVKVCIMHYDHPLLSEINAPVGYQEVV